MTFPVRFLDEIRARVALAQVIGQSVKLTRKGREYSGLCPFHNEKSPSFTVNEDKGFFHCLAAETGVILRDGVRAIGSLSGTTQSVLTRGGVWVDAAFKSYGVQRLHRITLTRNGLTKTIHATSGHRWFVRGVTRDVLTSELRPGHRLDAVLPEMRQEWGLDPAGVVHGVVFGDGSVQKGYGHVHLHGEKDRVLAGWFSGYSAVPKIRDTGASYLRIYGGKAFGHMKAVPSLDEASDAYLLGFLAGYIAADGHVAKDGTVMLNSADRDHLEWVRAAATRLGIGTYGITRALRKGFGAEEAELFRVHFVPSTLNAALFLGEEAKRRFISSKKSFARLRWVVASVEESDRVEEVYCAEVPGEHAFALEDNILTGNCFGCGAHGDVITFLMRARHMSFPDAVEQLAGQAGLDLPEQTPQDREREKRQAGLHDVTEAAAQWFEEQLWKPAGRTALEYLRNRGLDEETIRRFRLGWSPESRTGLKTAIKEMGELLAVEAGLLIKPEEGGDSFDRFRSRVMFPITDRRGRVIAFGGRIMGDGQPKYLNSPDTPLFHKGHNLYGWALAREAAAKTGTVLVAEGYMDVIALHKAGFGNAVAPLGTAVTEEQIELMWREVAEPILCLDGDAAGQRAAIRAAERALTILKPGRSLRFATLPAPEDPDSLIKKAGAGAMQAVCDQAMSLSDTLWRTKFQPLPIATPEQRAGVEQQIKQVLGVIPDQGLQRDYIFDFIRRLREAARPQRQPSAWQPFSGGRRVPQKPVARRYAVRDPEGRVMVSGLKPSLAPTSARQLDEQLLMMIVLSHPLLLDEVSESLGEVGFADSNLDKLRQEVLIHAHDYARLDRQGVYDYLKSRGFSQTLDCLMKAVAYESIRNLKPDASLEDVRTNWDHVYRRYKGMDLAVDLELARQESAANLTEETFGFFSALRSGEDPSDDI